MARHTATSVLILLTNCFRHHRSPTTSSDPTAMSTCQCVPPAPRRAEGHGGGLSLSAISSLGTTKDEKLVCLICANKIKKDRFCRPCRKCKEPWCYECIRNLFTNAIKDSERMPARCCQNVIHHAVAKGVLDENKYATYKLRYEEFCTPKPFYCPIPTCSTFIPPRQLKSADHHKRLACPACATRLCTKCRQTADPGHQCSSKEDAVLSKIRALKYKSCPKCGTGVLKMYGCDHIRCHCGAHWCWSCQRSTDICFTNPCQAQLDDGADPDPDTDDEDDVIEAENRTTTMGPIDGTPYEYPTPSELALASAEQTGVEQPGQTGVEQSEQTGVEQSEQTGVEQPEQTRVEQPEQTRVEQPEQTGVEQPEQTRVEQPEQTRVEQPEQTRVGQPELVRLPPPRPEPAALAELESADAAASPLPSSTTNVSVQSASVIEENLDDPDEHDWEYQDMNFGAEPTDERWDVWGCAHKCRRFNQEDIYEKWLKAEDIDCQNCFEHVQPHGPAESSVAERLAWLCKKCGVIFCEQCRRDIRARRKQ